jgi:hypothetical protein
LLKISLEEAHKMYRRRKVLAFFSDAKTLNEKQKFDKLAKTKTFAPFILLA